MTNSFGLDKPENKFYLDKALETLSDIEECRKPAIDHLEPESTFAQIQSRIFPEVPLTGFIQASFQAAEENLSLLGTLAVSSQQNKSFFSPWSIAPLSRSALVSTCRILYVLLPPGLNEKVENATSVIKNDLLSMGKYYKTAPESFGPEYGEDHGKDMREGLAKIGRQLPGSQARDGHVVSKAVEMVEEWIHRTGLNDTNWPDSESADWMWNTWSGISHGYLWNVFMPSNSDRGRVEVMPGPWLRNFYSLTRLARLGQYHIHMASRG